MENLKNGKVLVVMDRTYKNCRTDKVLYNFENLITDCLNKSGYDVEFRIMTSFVNDFEYDVDSEALMYEVDDCSAYACLNDYDCVIAEGFSAWFWLQAMYPVPVLCVNPIINPDEEFEDFMTDEISYSLETLFYSRGFQTNNAMCVLSLECYDDVKNIDNVFYDNTVVRTEDSINSKEFWSINGKLVNAIKYIQEHYA